MRIEVLRYRNIMMRAVIGVKGAGKSKFATIRLIEELRSSTRAIVTNLALEFQPWVDAKGVARPGLLRVLQDTYGSNFDAVRLDSHDSFK